MPPASPQRLDPPTIGTWLRGSSPRPITAERPLLLAVSGGVDSMVLWALVAAAGLPHAVAHVNYGLRGTASEADEALVRGRAAELAVGAHVRREPIERGASLQARARQLRRAFFAELLPGHAAVALAHHADDQAETVLMRLARGAGIEGLAGMRPVRGPYLRPLLGIPRSAIEAFAKTHGVAYRDDASNAGLDYARNRWRHLVVPTLIEVEPRTVQGVGLSAKHLADVLAFARDRGRALLEAARRETAPAPAPAPAAAADGRPPTVTTYDRPMLAAVDGLGGWLGIWLAEANFARAEIDAIAGAIADGRPHRREFHSNGRATIVVVAGTRVEVVAADPPAAAPVPDQRPYAGESSARVAE